MDGDFTLARPRSTELISPALDPTLLAEEGGRESIGRVAEGLEGVVIGVLVDALCRGVVLALTVGVGVDDMVRVGPTGTVGVLTLFELLEMEEDEGVDRRVGRGDPVGVEIAAKSTLARIRGWDVGPVELGPAMGV